MAKSIDVSTSVFAAIWAARREGEETEDEILRRVLGVKPNDAARAKNPSTAKTRWVDDIVEALKSLGGGGTYPEIYDAVRALRLQAGRSIPNSFQEVVRKEIETHSRDSDAFTHREDLFRASRGKGQGYWSLKK